MPINRKAASPVAWSDVCKLGEQFPGVEQSTSFGRPALKVKGKFLILIRDEEHLVVHIDKESRELVMAADSEAFYITDHYKNYPAMLIRIAKVTKAQLHELLEQAWRSQAPRALLKAFSQ